MVALAPGKQVADSAGIALFTHIKSMRVGLKVFWFNRVAFLNPDCLCVEVAKIHLPAQVAFPFIDGSLAAFWPLLPRANPATLRLLASRRTVFTYLSHTILSANGLGGVKGFPVSRRVIDIHGILRNEPQGFISSQLGYISNAFSIVDFSFNDHILRRQNI